MTRNISIDKTVAWQLAGIEIHASEIRPAGSGPFPAVIMVAGSGPTDRNWTTPLLPGSNGSAALLARALTDLGYITLRYDKAASGAQGPENAQRMAGKFSMQSHREELAGGVRLLADNPDVDSERIFVLTNSEGAIHAWNYQNQAPDPAFAGLVLTAPPARPVGVVARWQIEGQLKAMPDGEKWLAAYDAVMLDFTAGREVNVDENLPEWLRLTLLGITNPMNQPFARELWLADPAALFATVSAPTLIVIGMKDLQVDWQADGVIFESLKQTHANLTTAYPENANHVLKFEPLDRSQLTAAQAITTYNAEDSVLDPESLDIITGWIAAHL